MTVFDVRQSPSASATPVLAFRRSYGSGSLTSMWPNSMLEAAAQAEAAAEHGLAAEFDTIVTDESNHRDELRLMLARWP